MTTSFWLQLGFVVLVSVIVIGGARWLSRKKAGQGLRQGLMAHRVPLALGLAGVLMALLGATMALHAQLSATVDVDLAQLQAGGEPAGSFVATEGVAVAAERYCSRGRGGRMSCYTPFWSAEAARDRLALVIHGSDPRDGQLRLSGYAGSEPQLHVRRGLEAKGLKLAEHARVLMVGETPNERVKIGAVIGMAGLGLLLFAWGWVAVATRRRRGA